mgnify:CR=1 FL=1
MKFICELLCFLDFDFRQIFLLADIVCQIEKLNGPVFEIFEQLVITITNGSAGALHSMVTVVWEMPIDGASVHFFPEGTRSEDGFLQMFHKGAFQLAIDLNCDIVPLVLCDTRSVVPRNAYWVESSRPVIKALPRVTPENSPYDEGARPLMKHVKNMMSKEFNNLLSERNTHHVLQQKVRRRYRHLGTLVEQYTSWKLKADPLFKHLHDRVPRQGTIVDLGCGYGLAVHWLAETEGRRKFIGVDYDSNKIRLANCAAGGHKRITFETADITRWEAPPCHAILLFDVLHYLKRDDQEQLLHQCFNWLNEGGVIIIREGLRQKSKRHHKVEFWDKWATAIKFNKTRTSLDFMSKEDFGRILTEAGFSDLHCDEDGGLASNAFISAVKQ